MTQRDAPDRTYVDGPPDAFGSPYRLLAAGVVPRPIAWVASVDPDGIPNLAPFSFFNVVSIDPPIVMFAPVGTGDELKDTARNVLDTEELVIHVVTTDLTAEMNATSSTLPDHEDEFAHAGVETAASVVVDVPRVADADVAFEGTLYDAQEVGSSTMILAEIVHVHVDESLLTDGKFDVTDLDAVGRLSGSLYATTRDRFSMERPP